MNTDDLREGLGDEARRQPPISPDFRPGVDHQVRRQRLRAAAVVTPLLILVLVAAALLVPRGAQDTTVSAADGGSAGSVVPAPGSTVAEASTTVAPTTSAPEVPSPTVPTTPTPSEAPTTAAPSTGQTGGDCGTITASADHQAAIDKAPMTCFAKALNADRAATLTVVLDQQAAGTITEQLVAAPGKVVTVTAHGAITVKLPAMAFGNGGGGSAFPTDQVPAGGDCGTITMSMGDKPSASEMKVGKCLLGAFTKGGAAHVAIVMTSPDGGSMTADISISADHVLTMKLDGTLTMTLPAGMKVPEDLLSEIPSGKMGLGSMPGMPGMGGFGGKTGKTTTTTTK